MTTAADPAEILKGLDVGVAVVDLDGMGIAYENAQFFQWFPATGAGDETLADRIPGFAAAKAASRLADGRPYSFDTEVGAQPRATAVRVELRAMAGDASRAILEARDVSGEQQIQFMLDSYSELAERNARDLQKEKERVERLLLNIMPRAVFEEMKDFGTTTPQRFDSASILMLDFVGFTDMAISHDPSALISELNDIFSAFDRIVELFDCERMKTIGDAYMAVSGIPDATTDHAQNIARVALRMRRYLERRNRSSPESWLCRIGIDSGPVVGSIVGVQKYVYDIFGPGVNLAARLEAVSDPMEITLSERTYALIRDEFVCEELGEVEVKGFGRQRLYTLEGEHGQR
jgi:adenylate cyclase